MSEKTPNPYDLGAVRRYGSGNQQPRPDAIRGLPQAHKYDETQYYEKADCPPYYCCATCIERGLGIRYASDPIHASGAGAAPEEKKRCPICSKGTVYQDGAASVCHQDQVAEPAPIPDERVSDSDLREIVGCHSTAGVLHKMARELLEARQTIGRLTLDADASRTYASNVVNHANEYLHKIASLEQQLSALKASHAELEQDKDAAEMRLERIRTPKVYEGTYYTNAPIPEYCPECDGRTFISAGPRGMVCYICSLLAANEELESEKAAAHEAGFAEALEAAAEVCHRMGDEREWTTVPMNAAELPGKKQEPL